MKKLLILLSLLILTISVFGIYNPDENVTFCDDEKTVVCGSENDTVAPTLMMATETATNLDVNSTDLKVVESNNYSNGKSEFNLDKITVFYGQGCPHCAQLKSYLDSMKKKYPDFEYDYKEVYSDAENRDLIVDFLEEKGNSFEGVPTTVYKGAVFVGYDRSIKEAMTSIVEDNYVPKNENENNSISKGNLTIFAVIAASLVDAINPCAFAVLILLLTAIMHKKDKKKTLMAGLLFTFAIFLSYLLMGLGIYKAIASSQATSVFYLVVAILAIILGLLNIKDYFWYGKFILMEVPQSWRPHMKKIISHVTSPIGAFFAGIVVSMFLLPCTSGPYIVILGMLSDVATKSYATMMLILYNAIFVLPMIVITLLVTFGGAKTKKLEKLRSRNLSKLHLIAGLILVGMGIFLLLSHYAII